MFDKRFGVSATKEDFEIYLEELEILSERITEWTAGAHLAHDHLKQLLELNMPLK